MDYGYCRISTKKQHIERQIRKYFRVLSKGSNCTRSFYRNEISRAKRVKPVIEISCKKRQNYFDSVSRMARNADEGCQLYEHLYNTGIELVFLNTPN